MSEKTIDSMNEATLTPSEFITLMFERTDADGILYIPGWHYDCPGGSTDEDSSYRCKMRWNLDSYERVLNKFNRVYSAIRQAAAKYDELFIQRVDPALLLESSEAVQIFNQYLTELDDGAFDRSKYEEIYDKLDTIEWVKAIAARVAEGEKILDFEKETLTEYLDMTVTEEELEYRARYTDHIHKEAEKRLGDNVCAYDVLIRSRRLCRLMSLGAPQIIINNEGRQLAAAFVLHECGQSRELVDNNVRLRLERLEGMSDDELDELYRPKKTNTRKSLAPLFVYEVLSKKSSTEVHLRQQDILKELEMYPYEISLERKALSRIIHNLVDSGYGIYSDKTGVWMEKEDKD